MLCTKFGWNLPSVSGGEDENVKSLQTDSRTDGQMYGQTMDTGESEKITSASSSGEPKMLFIRKLNHSYPRMLWDKFSWN